ncbi:MAG: MFS transporter [Bacilli bacterium]|nr:MFS transporter [Bacilli bacterium]
MENNTQSTQGRTFNGFDQKINWGTRLAYAGGDVACNIVFGMIGALLTSFYTDTVMIDAAIIGYIMLGSRVFDGFSDIIMGIVVEKTHSRWGKARPWLLWMSIPFCLSAVLLFTVPQGAGVPLWGKILYIAVTYNFCTTICYTAINLPYGTLSTLMTRSSHERDMLGNVRMGLSPLGKILAVTFTPILVGAMGGIQDQNAWAFTMAIWSSVGLVLLLINFIFCKEKVKPEEEKKSVNAKSETKKLPMKKGLKFLIKNQYFWAVLLLWMFQSVSFGVVGTTLPYYSKWVLGDMNLDKYYNTFFLVETLVLVGGVFICMPLMKKIGKRNMALAGGIFALVGQVIFAVFSYTVGFDNIPMLYAICVIRSIGLAPLNAVVFGMLGDVVDFGHWKNGVRQEAFISAGGSVGTKLGSGLASVIITQLLSSAGYDIDPSCPSSVRMIEGLYVWGPLIIAAGVVLVLAFYKLDKKYDAMMLALTKREWEEEQKKKSVQKDIAAVEKKPVDIDPELAKMMKEMKPLEGKENPIDSAKDTKKKK